MDGYGLWFLVVAKSAVFILFAASFFHPKTRRDWTAMGAFSACGTLVTSNGPAASPEEADVLLRLTDTRR